METPKKDPSPLEAFLLKAPPLRGPATPTYDQSTLVNLHVLLAILTKTIGTPAERALLIKLIKQYKLSERTNENFWNKLGTAPVTVTQDIHTTFKLD
jgi:hypothetical protein